MEEIKKLTVRSLREGFIQIWRNKFLSLSTVLLGSLIIFLINFIFSVNYYADYSLKNLEKRADFTVPLRKDYDEFLLGALKNELELFDLDLGIKKSESFDSFEVPPRIYLRFHDLEQVGNIFTVLKKIRYDSVVDSWDINTEREFTNLINKLVKIRVSMEKVNFWLLCFFLIGGSLLAINTFRIAIFSRKEEIYIARFVGADPKFITWPFLVEGFLLGIIASIVGIFIFILVLRKIDILPGGEIFLFFWNNIFSNEILFSSLVGTTGAWIAIQRYLSGQYTR